MIDDEYEVIREVQQGNVNAFEVLVKNHQSSVFNLLYNMVHQHALAEELTQEVFVKAYENLHTFNFENRFFSWIYRIAINTAISFRKKQRPTAGLNAMPQETISSGEETIIAREREIILQQAIGQLNSKLKPVIVLKYFEQLSYFEIAKILGIKEEKVKSRLFDARKTLKNYLEQNGYF